MKKYRAVNNNIFLLYLVGSIVILLGLPSATVAEVEYYSVVLQLDTGDNDTDDIKLRYPIQDNSLTPFNPEYSPFDLEEPDNIKQEMEYDPETGQYRVKQQFEDGSDYRPDNFMDFDDYMEYDFDKSVQKYWQDKVSDKAEFEQARGLEIPEIEVDNKMFDRIFGGNTIDIRPSGSAELIFGLNTSRTENPALPERQRKISIFDFDQRIQLNVAGQIGDKLQLNTNYNTEATFNFENQVKLDYTGYDDDILQKVEAGNVTLPLNSSLIQGSQSLFGIKTQMRFGRLTVTSVVSQERGEKENITVEGGAQMTEFEIRADNYEEDKHYFLSHFFRDQYEDATANPPFVGSQANITKIEVWVTNTNRQVQNTRNILAFQDLGESNPDKLYNGSGNVQVTSQRGIDDNRANSLFESIKDQPAVRGFLDANNYLDGQGLESRMDYHKVGLARKLQETEYTFHPQLGYITVNQRLQPNQVLAVAFQYNFRGETFQVGEFATDIPAEDPLLLKMLKSTELRTDAPMWDLMMKNVYSLGAYQVQPKDFLLEVWYMDQSRGLEINFISDGPEEVNGKPLIQTLGLDRLDINNNPRPDGIFDFLTFQQQYVPTINPQNGRVYFPTLEPFGRTLREKLQDERLGDIYAFDSLYAVPKEIAKVNYPDKNRFTIKGHYSASGGNEISLNALNVPEGSVKVTAGGRELVEDQDYTVDYTLGRVKILNDGLMESGTPINVSLESNAMFNLQQKTLLGSRFDYKINEDFILGGTVMNLTERPITQKVNMGEEPMSNTVWGVDGTYRSDAPWLTKLIDKIPGIDTKEESNIQVSGEFAQLIPGASRAIGEGGNAYIDDFEGSQTTIDLRTRQMWSLASVPQKQPDLFPEAELSDNLASNFNRALFSWYTIDPLFFRNDARTPDHISEDATLQSNHFMRQIPLDEVFPNRQPANAQFNNIPTFDLAFYPEDRGPYNYDVDGTDVNGNRFGHGVRLGDDGGIKLNNPSARWGGIQRPILQQDFNSSNVEYIQFWVMDPFNDDYEYGNSGGKLYFNFGTISEDVQKDGQILFENLVDPDDRPADRVLNEEFISAFGRYTPGQQYVKGFDNNPESRNNQDVGLDGLRDDEERVFFDTYINDILSVIPQAEAEVLADPSGDNFQYFQGEELDQAEADVLERYKFFNNPDGNSPITGNDGAAAIGTNQPDGEDINDDNNLDDIENYWQYEVDMSRQSVNPDNIGNNYITDVLETEAQTVDGRSRTIRWYQFRIPLDDGVPIGNIRDFRSIRFMRMFMTGFENPVVLRFARLELVRGEWRRYSGNLKEPGDYQVEDQSTRFVQRAVNIEENSQRRPVNYVLPPDIEREINIGTTNLQQLNEQSLEIEVCDLKDGEARAVFRKVEVDALNYGQIEAYIHAESGDESNPLRDGEVTAFVRLGTDFEQNYYEYEIPLKITPPGVYNEVAEAGRLEVWPEENNIEIDLDMLREAKMARDRAEVSSGGTITKQTRYAYPAGKATIHVVGAPNLASVQTIMLGIRNPKAIQGSEDDGLPKCATVWFNEMRMSEFDDNSGWAAISQVNAKLADLGTISFSAAMSTPGWGSIDNKVSERQRETIQEFDVSSNLQMGRFFGKDAGIRLPTYLGYAEMVTRPQFAPLAPDLEFDDYVNQSFPEEGDQDSVRRIQETRIIRRSVNLTNIRKEKTNPERKSRFYDISNFSATLSYAQDRRRNFETEYDDTKTYRGGLTYTFAPSPNAIKPFEKIGFLNKSKYLQGIKDFNFFLLPKQIGFVTNMNRMYNERKMRNNQPEITADMPPFYNKSWNWNRTYNLRWDLTEKLGLDFEANNQALVQEPEGAVNRNIDPDGYDQWRDSVWASIRDFGTNMRYNHRIGLNYEVPLDKIPALQWVSSSARYNATYDWERAAFAADSLGGTIQNTRQLSLNTTFNFTQLYGQIGFLDKIIKKAKKAEREKQREKQRKKRNPNDTTEREDNSLNIFEHIIKSMMMVKNASVNYSLNEGIMLPGYNQEHRVLGMNPSFDAPGPGFLVGQQRNFGPDNERFLEYAQSRNWLVREEAFNKAYSETYSERFDYRVTIEPIKDLNVTIQGNWDQSTSFNAYNRWYDTLTTADGEVQTSLYNLESPINMGNFSRSFFGLNTTFASDRDEFVNEAFENFSDYRSDISRRLSEQNPFTSPDTLFRGDSIATDATYYQGYGPNHPDVMIPAFIAAYSGKTPDEIDLSPFSKIPMPNWRLQYTGLTKIEFLEKYFKSVTLSHAYQSTFSVAGFRNNVLWQDDSGDGFTAQRDPINGVSIIARNEYQTINITEQFAPLFNLDMTWKNSLITRVEMRYDRALSLNIANAQVTEVKGEEYVVGLGYTFDNVKVPFTLPSKQEKIQSDLRLQGDFSIRNNVTVLRKLDTPVRPNEPTSGQRVTTIKLTADYSISQNLNIRFFYDRVVNTPAISLTFPTTNTNVGLSIRFQITG